MNKHAQYIYILTLFALFLSGCGSIEVHQIFLRQPPMHASRDIELYVEGAPPRRPYYDVAVIQAIGQGSDADVEDVTHAIANRAARIGCDAVVRVHVELGATRAHGSGVCVNWARVVPVREAAPPTKNPSPQNPPQNPPQNSPQPPPASETSGGVSI